MIFGKNAEALRELTKLIRLRDNISKYYLTIVCGSLKEPLALNDRLKRDTDRNISHVIKGDDGKEAVTYVTPVLTGRNSLLRKSEY